MAVTSEATPGATPSTRRSDTTRAAILAAARARFTHQGFERTTIRQVAGDAEIDPAMVMRYFTNKEGLFEAAVDVDLLLPQLDDVAPAELGRALVTHFVTRWEAPGGDALRLLLASATTFPAAAERAKDVVRQQVLPCVEAAHDGRLTQPGLRAALIAAQMTGLATSRYVLRVEPLASLEPAELVSWVAPVVDHYLDPGSGGVR